MLELRGQQRWSLENKAVSLFPCFRDLVQSARQHISYRNHNPQDGTIANGLDHCHSSQLGLHPLDNFRHRARPLPSHPSRLPASFAPLQSYRAFFKEIGKGGSSPVTVHLALAGPPALFFDGVETSKSLPNTTGVQQYTQYTETLAVAVILLTSY